MKDPLDRQPAWADASTRIHVDYEDPTRVRGRAGAWSAELIITIGNCSSHDMLRTYQCLHFLFNI